MDKLQPTIPNEIICQVNYLELQFLMSAINSIENRKELIDSGIKSAEEFILKL